MARKCPACGESFEEEDEYRAHIYTHSSRPPPLSFERAKGCERVARSLEGGSLTLEELTKSVGMSRASVLAHLGHLEKRGMVTKVRVQTGRKGGRVLYAPTKSAL